MKVTLEAINQMQANGVIGQCAIGGAVGATLCLEPAATLDVDGFRRAIYAGGEFVAQPGLQSMSI